MHGIMPAPGINHENNATFGRDRFILRTAWNGRPYNNKNRRILTPFRAVMNAGDVLSRESYACGGGSCQTAQSRPGVHGLSARLGSATGNCIPSVWSNLRQLDARTPAGTCNVKYVYDSSDYTTYLKRRAVNQNYNDRSFGGDDSFSAQSQLKRTRH